MNFKCFIVCKFLQIIFLFIFCNSVIAQITIKGKVTDGTTGEPIPFANVFFKGQTKVVQTDFDGFYTIQSASKVDSICVVYVGYTIKKKPVIMGVTEIVDFVLLTEGVQLQTVVIRATENPAYGIIRKAVANKKQNNISTLKSYEYETYSRVELAIDNISNKMKKRRIMRPIAHFLDSTQKLKGEDGRPILPVFISESISKYYFADLLPRNKERILATKVTGVGVKDGSTISQLIGSTFSQYDFYDNYVPILGKDFASPLNDQWKVFYEYFLADSMYIDKDWCYKIDVDPRNTHDLAFRGAVWIVENSWALKRIEVSVDNKANINFVEKIKIQQELAQTKSGPWLPKKLRIILDIAEPADSSAGMIAKYYSSNTNFETNHEYDKKFFDQNIELDEDATKKGDAFWQEHRQDTLTDEDKLTYKMVDSLKNLPVIRSYIEIADIAINGHKKVGWLDFGPYLTMYSKNNIEGSRFSLGLRTNIDFSKYFVFRLYGAYGTLDNQWKYGASAKVIFSRKKWTEAGVGHVNDINQLGFMNDGVDNNSLFKAFSRWGTLRRAFYYIDNNAYFSTQLSKDFSTKISVTHFHFNPLFNFGYYVDHLNPASEIKNQFDNFETTLELRFAHNERFIQNDNERLAIGTVKWPILTAKYSKGHKGVFNSGFEYDKVSLMINHQVKTGILGTGHYSVRSSMYFNTLPYPLLQIHLGNETFFYNTSSYNLMNFFEFVSDKYISLNYMQQFDGFFLNRVPFIHKYKWRELIGINTLWGTVANNNQLHIPSQFSSVDDKPAYRSMSDKPYIELNYGIENIFKFLRVIVIQRVSYLNTNYPIHKFGVKVAAHFRL